MGWIYSLWDRYGQIWHIHEDRIVWKQILLRKTCWEISRISAVLPSRFVINVFLRNLQKSFYFQLFSCNEFDIHCSLFNSGIWGSFYAILLQRVLKEEGKLRAIKESDDEQQLLGKVINIIPVQMKKCRPTQCRETHWSRSSSKPENILMPWNRIDLSFINAPCYWQDSLLTNWAKLHLQTVNSSVRKILPKLFLTEFPYTQSAQNSHCEVP